ncbi:Alpha/Beta hydrolase protein [Vararia minispora EC-137]|uniref:Alpha/Beta hydrolase protein n=1 Tax=Vararia minispora EC-137 TaxID=1314806 RepID=A0ACB8QAE2_9AGAM|nr:Alpha/Beta hydrolase protein [Vararia minispora EC-137]
MIDHIVGRPSPSWKRTQVFLVLIFWIWRIVWGDPRGPRLLWIRRLNKRLARSTPWQVVVSTLTAVYIIRNLDKILGLGAPEPLAQLYSPSYYRATWIVTGLDAGFATAMNIRPKWFRELCSILFSAYYIIYANEADEKLRRFRAVPTVEMLRATWNKTSNPIIRLAAIPERVAIYRKLLLARPSNSPYTRPITVYLFFSPGDSSVDPTTAFGDQQDLILDFPGGGFVAMSPEHHEERLRRWAVKTGKVIASIDYGKAPEYPYPYAIDEAFDVYRLLAESKGKAIGMSGRSLNMILTGDSAGATLAVSVVIKILEHTSMPASKPPHLLPLPIAVVLSYAALDFNFTSWMSQDNLRVLQDRKDISWANNLRGTKDHLSHVSPLSVVDERKRQPIRRRKSWKESIRFQLTQLPDTSTTLPNTIPLRKDHTSRRFRTEKVLEREATESNDEGAEADGEQCDVETFQHLPDEEKPIKARVRWNYGGGYSPAMTPASLSPVHSPKLQAEVTEANEAVAGRRKREGAATRNAPIGTRLTMTSRTGYFQDRIISPSMMRAMAILYIGPHRNPDFASDYRISPILAPSQLLAQFPPLLMQCGEKDPFVDDTIIFAGRVREAKRERKEELCRLIHERRTGSSFRKTEDIERLETELDKLESEEDEDWVQMQIFPDWSHGYLQMPMLMREATEVIDDLAKWMDDAFSINRPIKSADKQEANGSGPQVRTAVPDGALATDTEYETMGGTRSSMASETETDADDLITLVPKARRLSLGTVSLSSGDSTVTHRAYQLRGVTRPGSPVLEDGERQSRALTRSPKMLSDPPKPSTPTRPGVMGQTLTEVELVRRRRLLDSHIFQSDAKDGA